MKKEVIASIIVFILLGILFYAYYTIVSQAYPPDPLIFLLVFVLACFVFIGPVYYIISRKEQKKSTPLQQEKHGHPILRNCPKCKLLLPGHLTKCPNCGMLLDEVNLPKSEI